MARFRRRFGPLVAAAVRKATAKPLNVHLMVMKPERHLEHFARAGADHLLVPCEPASTIHLHRVLSRIRELGKKAGAVPNPASPIALVEHVLHLCDVVLVMAVNPGFGGVPARSAAEDQGAAQPVRAARARAVDRGRRRTGRRDAWRAVEAGADAIVAGTAILGASDCAAAIARLRSTPPPVA